MPLSQEDRIAISKKIVAVPLENQTLEGIKATLLLEKGDLLKKDNANKSLIDDLNPKINGYQLELANYDGNARTEYLEQDLIDSVNRVSGNFYFPNNNVPTPSIPSGVWKNFGPFLLSKALGKTYAEIYTSTPKESDYISIIQSTITQIEALTAIQRVTGLHCISAHCSLPQYTDQVTCELNGGVWTSSDSIESNAVMQGYSTTVINNINSLKNLLTATYNLIITNDTSHTSENQQAKDDITSSLTIINNWLSVVSFNTSHGQTTCFGFNSYNADLLAPTKYHATTLNLLKNELVRRSSYVSTRVSQLQSYLGTVTQDLSTGNILTATGLYGKRARFIDLRINTMSGTLSNYLSSDQAINVQNIMITNNNNMLAAYNEIMVATLFRAHSGGTALINLMATTGLNVGDSVYVVSDTAEEISATILAKNDNSITINKIIPTKYTKYTFSRVYKLL